MIGRLWWKRDGSMRWGVEVDGELYSSATVELRGCTLRTAIAPVTEGSCFPGLPDKPHAIVEFEASEVRLELPGGVLVRTDPSELRPSVAPEAQRLVDEMRRLCATPDNDNNAPTSAGEKQ